MAGNREPVAVARIRNQVGQVAGSGFLVAPDLVLTCTHVVRHALDTKFTSEPPDGAVELDFPLPDGVAKARATVVAWTPENSGHRGDTTLLRLTEPLPGLPVARLSPQQTSRDEPVRIFGYALLRAHGPGDVIAGVAVTERAGMLQINTEGELQVERGYSGSPVYRADGGAVVGMVVQTVTGGRSCNAVPVNALLENFAELGEPDPAAASPYRGLQPFEERHADRFHGRADLTATLVEAIRRRPLLIVMGPSGSGKSSLVRAGLVPAVRAAKVESVTDRLFPGEQAETMVARLVLQAIRPDAGSAEERGLAERLRTERSDALAGLARALDERAGDDGLLLFVDQLEEAPPPAVESTIELLHGLVRSARRRPDGTVRVAAVVTLRARVLEDTVGPEVAEAVRRAAIELVRPMSPDELRDAIRAGGVRFEAGLDERILAEAGDEPGRLPLIEFTLERLWQDRGRFDELSIEVYKQLGGVSGALATYADEVLSEQPEEDRERFRAVLTAMARPADDGAGFRRQPLELDGRDAAELVAIKLLARSRLVVVSEPAGRPSYAELAHQALLESWPALREWLTADREFLVWRDRLRTDRKRWVASGEDPDALLRGAALAEAQRWTAARTADLDGADLGFVRAGQARERRRVRVLRTVIAVVTALAVLATLLAVVVVWRSAALADQVRAGVSRQLAAHSQRFRDSNPAKALQFAQAAWHADKTPEAYGALLTQFAMLDRVDRVLPNLWEGAASRIQASDDGQVVVIAGAEDPVVWRGLTGGGPVRVSLAGAAAVDQLQVDPSGRYVAGAADDGTVMFWDLARPDAPRTLSEKVTGGPVSPLQVGNLAFNGDGTRLLVFRVKGTTGANADTTVPDLRVWNLADGTAITSAVSLTDDDFRAYFGPRLGTVAIERTNQVVVADLASGRARTTFRERSARLAGNGATVIDCDTDNLRVRDIASGRTLRSIPIFCGLLTVDGTTNAVVNGAEVVDLRTGSVHRSAMPPVGDSGMAIVTPATGDLVALGVRGELLYRTRPTPATVSARASEADEKTAAPGARWVVTPDGRHAVTIRSSGEIELSETSTGQQIARSRTVPHLKSPHREPQFAITPDNRYLVIAEPDALAVHSLPALTRQRRLPLPEANLDGAVPPPETALGTTVAATGADRVVVLHHGILASWSAGTGEPAGPPLPITDGDAAARFEAAKAFITAVRPGHPHQVAIVLSEGTLQIWSLDQRKVVETVPASAAAGGRSAVFDTTGGLLAVGTRSGTTEIWEATERDAGRPVPSEPFVRVLGFTSERYLLVQSIGSPTNAQLWDIGAGLLLAELPAPDGGGNWTLSDGVLASRAREVSQVIRLDPDSWFQRLCDLNDRPFAAEEVDLLKRDKISVERPCP